MRGKVLQTVWGKAVRDPDTQEPAYRIKLYSVHRAWLGVRPAARNSGRNDLRVARRRAANKVARKSRRINRRGR